MKIIILLLFTSIISEDLPLYTAVFSEDFEKVKSLLQDGFDPNEIGEYFSTPLHLAAVCDRKNIINILLLYGADPNATDTYNETPLHKAAKNSRFIATRILLQNLETDISIKNRYGDTPYDLAKEEIIQALIRNRHQLVIQQKNGLENLCIITLRKQKLPWYEINSFPSHIQKYFQ